MQKEEFLKLVPREKLVIVSNRVPFNFYRTKEGVSYKRSVGGLVTALDPIMTLKGGIWIGWSGLSKKTRFLDNSTRITVDGPGDYQIKFVNLSENDINLFYHGFTNRTLWPLFHGFLFHAHFDHNYWNSYFSANKKYAKAVLEEIKGDELIWIHDYHLMLVPEMLRTKNIDLRIAFFNHIPFPNYETFRALPWHKDMLKGILGCNLVGFQTENDSDNFLISCKKLLKAEVDIQRSTVLYNSRTVKVWHFPISIDYEQFKKISSGAVSNKSLRSIRKNTIDKKIVLSVERLDYTKGIKERLCSIERFFEKYPEYRKRVVFIQVSVPSRTKIREYISFKNEIDELVGKINGRFAEEIWTPIVYLYKSLNREKLSAYYASADVCLVTPLRDGMNLIAKEFVTCKNDLNGVLILSEFAGCADELRQHSIMVNPYDTEDISDKIYLALKMDKEEKKSNIIALQKIVKENDVYNWCLSFLNYFVQAPQ